MTTAKTPPAPARFRLPDPPEREADEKMTSFDHLHRLGNAHHLLQHFIARDSRPQATLVAADRWIVAEPGSYRELARYPDLLIAFGVDPELYEAHNGYVISEQGKPPEFVLEVASASTGAADIGPKRRDYERLGIAEYWRFDETGEHHGARLAGDRLVAGRYEPFPVEHPADDVLQGYSPALDLYLRWEQGQLTWHDPATSAHIATFQSERDRADAAEARIRELEAELRRRQGE